MVDAINRGGTDCVTGGAIVTLRAVRLCLHASARHYPTKCPDDYPMRLASL